MSIKYTNIKMKIKSPIYSIDISKSNKLLVTGQQSLKRNDPSICICEINEDTIKYNDGLSLNIDNMAYNVNFCNNDKYLIIREIPNEIKVYNIASKEFLKINFKTKNLKI